MGSELSGEVEGTGKDVKLFEKGDLVLSGTVTALGANVEYICLKEKGELVIKPFNMTFEEATSVPFGATTSSFFLRDKGRMKEGQKVLVYDASGAVGT